MSTFDTHADALVNRYRGLRSSVTAFETAVETRRRNMNKFFRRGAKTMAGTEGTGKYRVVHESSVGGLAIRPLGNSTVRVRVEPCSAKAAKQIARTLTRHKGWKQPGDGGENRFSIVATTNPESHHEPLEFAIWAAARALRVRPSSRRMIGKAFSTVLAKQTYLAACKSLGFKGVNSRWSIETLVEKYESAQ